MSLSPPEMQPCSLRRSRSSSLIFWVIPKKAEEPCSFCTARRFSKLLLSTKLRSWEHGKASPSGLTMWRRTISPRIYILLLFAWSTFSRTKILSQHVFLQQTLSCLHDGVTESHVAAIQELAEATRKQEHLKQKESYQKWLQRGLKAV